MRWLEVVYKGNFDASTQLEIDRVGSTTTDLGGPKRQLLNQFMRQMPQKLNLVEVNDGVLFFTVSLLGNHYAPLGQTIVNSLLSEGPAFPCLPKAVYYYIIGGIDAAVPHVRVTS